MKRYDPAAAARSAVSAAPGRPAVAVLHDEEGGRLVVFRIEPGQRIAEHTSTSNVFLSVISGTGYVTGADGERKVAPGEIVAFAPREPHGMRAAQDELVLAALIAPRPGDA
ncbi:MAG TPA: cupin domain-containing protein [Gemmatimonadales bacterium]